MTSASKPIPQTPIARQDQVERSEAELIQACRSDLAGLGLSVDEELELIGAIRCIVQHVLSRKYRLHEDL